MSFIIFVFLITTLTPPTIAFIKLPCSFRTNDFSFIGHVYECHIEGEELITDKSNRIIGQVTDDHHDNREDYDVNSIWIDLCIVNYFPQELDYFFAKLEKIAITDSNLKELRREDLSIYPQLRHLDLRDNELAVLEENLFDKNPNLEDISLHHNKIAHIDAKVFDGLINKLRYLYLDHNACELESAINDRTKAFEIIQKIQRESCKDEEKLHEFIGIKSKAVKISTINLIFMMSLAIFMGNSSKFL